MTNVLHTRRTCEMNKIVLFISQTLMHFLVVFAAAFFAAVRCEATAVGDLSLPRIAANANQHAAGILSEGELTVELEIREGAFYPEDESGPSLRVFAFAERGKQLQIPGPMIRIPQDTRIHVTVHNLIARDVLIHGMHTRPGRMTTPLRWPARRISRRDTLPAIQS